MNKADSSSKQLRRALLSKQKREAEEVAQRLLVEPTSDPESEAKRVKAYDAILDKLDTDPSLEKWVAFAVAFVCVVIMGVLYSIPRGETKVLLELEVDTVSLRLAAPLVWPIGIAVTPPLQINGLNNLESLLYAEPLQSTHGDVWLQIDQGDTTLSELTLDKDGVIEVDIKPDRHYLSLRGTLSGSLLIAGQVTFQAGSKTDLVGLEIKKQLTGPESLDFTATEQGAVPTTLELGGKNPFVLYNIPVNGLAFVREVRSSVTESQFVSTILSGSISLPEVKEHIDLRPGERLKLEALSGRLTRLGVGEQIKIQFEGVAQGIRLGPQGFERDLEPSWLRYLYNQEKLAFAWSAFIFIWGILWSIRKTVFV